MMWRDPYSDAAARTLAVVEAGSTETGFSPLACRPRWRERALARVKSRLAFARRGRAVTSAHSLDAEHAGVSDASTRHAASAKAKLSTSPSSTLANAGPPRLSGSVGERDEVFGL
jgi:hypothetical protein